MQMDRLQEESGSGLWTVTHPSALLSVVFADFQSLGNKESSKPGALIVYHPLPIEAEP